jgi:hypothetical protein
MALAEIIAVEYLRGQLDVERSDGRHVRIGNLDDVGARLELSEPLAPAAWPRSMALKLQLDLLPDAVCAVGRPDRRCALQFLHFAG